ncbi:MAG: hypothetical protein R3B06_26750 [Kofleriaceae bacterium]
MRRPALLVMALSLGCRDAHPAPPAWPTVSLACAPPSPPRFPWRHRTSGLTSQLGAPRHVAEDVVVAAGRAATLRGKFSYGLLGKDLEDERVAALVAPRACAAAPAGDALTDDDGWVAVTLPAQPTGFRQAWLVAGDGTGADAGVWTLAPGTPTVVFDVDGTLTTDDGELFEELAGGVAEARPGAAAVVQAWAARGYLVVYLTGRPYLLRDSTRRWLDSQGFPYGPLFTPERLRQTLPTRASVGAFKLTALRALIASGAQLVRVYGNAATDVCAYAEAGVAPSATIILGTSTPCDRFPPPRTLSDYRAHLAEVEAAPRVR